jgi:hypothetical protein
MMTAAAIAGAAAAQHALTALPAAAAVAVLCVLVTGEIVAVPAPAARGRRLGSRCGDRRRSACLSHLRRGGRLVAPALFAD